MPDDFDRLFKKLDHFAVDAEKAIDQTVRLTALKVQRSAVSAIREPSVGTIYVRKGGVTHVSSKPGDAPNTDTGRLIGDINMVHEKGTMEALVGTDVEYGAYLELLMNRPWLQPALNKNIGDYAKNLERALDRQIKKAGQ